MNIDWLELLRVSVGPTFAAICVFEGVRRLSRAGRDRVGMLFLAVGFIFFCIYAAFGHYAHVLNKKAVRMSEPLAIPELPETWGQDFSQEIRIKNSLQIAQVAFGENGRLQKHFVEPGTWVLYAPTQEEIRSREEMIRSVAGAKYYAEITEWLPVRWALIAAVCAVLGAAFGRIPESGSAEPR